MGIRLINYVNNQLQTPALYTDAFASRPAAGIYGRLFMSTDTKEIFQDLTTTWQLLADAGAGAGTLQSVCSNGSTTTTGITITSNNLALTNAASSFYIKALTVGSVLFCDDVSGLVSQDNTNFFWDNTNNRLGLGTATPSARLDVHSSSGTSAILNGTAASNALLTFQNTGVSKWSIGNFVSSTVANDFNIYDTVNTVSRLQVHNTGVVNIPTTLIIGTTTATSAYTLDVTGSGRYTSTLLVTGIATFSNNVLLSATNRLYLSSTSYIQEVTAGTIRLAPAGNDSFDITSTALNIWVPTTIDSNSVPLILNSTASGGGYFSLQRSGTSYAIIGNAGSVTGSNTDSLAIQATNNLYLQTSGNNTRLTIVSSGSVLINKTTDNGDKLQVTGNVSISLNLAAGAGSNSSIRLYAVGSDTTSSNYGLYIQNSAFADLFLVRNDGVIYTGTTSNSPYNNAQSGRTAIIASNGIFGYLVSTRESKANIESIKNIDFINQLNPVQFNYRKKDDKTNIYTDEVETNINYGFIADEVEKVNKELVFYNDDGKTLAGVEYNNMIAILTKAVQELNEKLIRNNIN